MIYLLIFHFGGDIKDIGPYLLKNPVCNSKEVKQVKRNIYIYSCMYQLKSPQDAEIFDEE